jgi:hypothetical protein
MTRKDQDPTASTQPAIWNDGGVYEIKIKGHLDDHWKQWFGGMVFRHIENGEDGLRYTLMIGPLVDQPALHGLLAKIRDLNLTLISVRKIGSASSDRKNTV